VRYYEITNIPEAVDLRSEAIWRDKAKQRIKELNRERLEWIAIAVERELYRYLSPSQWERFQIGRRVSW
jgi:hypothetical protein